MNEEDKYHEYRKSLISQHLSKVKSNTVELSRRHDVNKKKHRDILIDERFDYMPTLHMFKQEAKIKRMGTDKEYLEFLHSSMKIYSSSAFYHLQYTDSGASEEHKAIENFCKEEIDSNLNQEKKDILVKKELASETPFAERAQAIAELNKIWKTSPLITVDELLTNGYEVGMWDEKITLSVRKKHSLYGSGYVFLSALCRALKSTGCLKDIPDRELGKAFCLAFNKPMIRKDKKGEFKEFDSPDPGNVTRITRVLKDLINSPKIPH